MEKKLYKISVDGCDASTNIEVELTDSEAVFLADFAAKVTAEAKTHCQPSMEITPHTEEKN